MKVTRKIDFGEYIVTATYDKDTGEIKVSVLDELQEEVESITIANDESEETPDNNDPIDLQIGLN
jgi:hypothetical protein